MSPPCRQRVFNMHCHLLVLADGTEKTMNALKKLIGRHIEVGKVFSFDQMDDAPLIWKLELPNTMSDGLRRKLSASGVQQIYAALEKNIDKELIAAKEAEESSFTCPQIMETKHYESPLLRLPAEILNCFYRYVLVKDNVITIPPSDQHIDMTRYDKGKATLRPALLETCRKFRTDATSIYYLENSFQAFIKNINADRFVRWLQASPERRKVPVTFKVRTSSTIIEPRFGFDLLFWVAASSEGKAGRWPELDSDRDDVNFRTRDTESLFKIMTLLLKYNADMEDIKAVMVGVFRILGVVLRKSR